MITNYDELKRTCSGRATKVIDQMHEIQNDIRSLRSQVAGSKEIFDKLCWSVFAEFQATLAKRFRVTVLDSVPSQSGPQSKVRADPAELLDRVHRAENVSVSDCVDVIHCVIRENMYLREQFSASRFKAIILERKLKSTADDCKIKSCANQRSREQLSALEAVTADLRKQLTERHAEVERLRVQVEALEQKQSLTQLGSSSVFERGSPHRNGGDSSPRGDFASPLFEDIHQPKSPRDFGRSLDSTGGGGATGDSRVCSSDKVVERIYKKHSDWSSKWELKSDEQRRAEEHMLCRTACERFEVQSSHHVALPGSVLPFSSVTSPSPKLISLSFSDLPSIHVYGTISAEGPQVSGAISPQRPSISQGMPSPRSTHSAVSARTEDRSPSLGSIRRTTSQDAISKLSPKLEPNAMVVAPPPLFDVSTRKWTRAKR